MEVRLVRCRTATSPSGLPGLDLALNPYRGCAHACAYCYAQDVTRFEPDLPWGSVVEVKTNIVQMLRRELSRGPKGVYGVGTVTDPYQPLERKHELTRGCLALLRRAGAKASVLTKSDAILRDLEVLVGWKGVEVGVSIGIPDERIASRIEPGAPPPKKRFEVLSALSSAGVDVYLMAAPIIPRISDEDTALRHLVASAQEAGVRRLIWDRWNPKPLASARLAHRLEQMGLELPQGDETERLRRALHVLSQECEARGIELVSSF